MILEENTEQTWGIKHKAKGDTEPGSALRWANEENSSLPKPGLWFPGFFQVSWILGINWKGYFYY